MKEKLNYSQQVCVKAAGKAMQSTKMLWPGAKVGVAVSGGVDSFVLLKVLQIRRRIVPFRFDFMALHLNPGFDPHNHEHLLPWLAEQGIAAHVELTDHGLRGHSQENQRNSACFYCARLRRKRLFELCKQYQLTHLAFGHNADDLVSTFLLNLIQTGRIDGLKMNDSFFGGDLQVIRPLSLVEKPDIIRAAKQWQLPIWSNPCPSAQSGKRHEMFAVLNQMTNGEKFKRKNIYNALIRWQFDQDSSTAAAKDLES